MKLEGDFFFQAPVEEVWQALFDPVVLAAVMPGCEKLDRVGDQYQGDLNIKVGPIQGKFGGKVDLTNVDEPKSYKMIVEGRGAPGFVKATAAVKLEREGEGTRLRYDVDAQVGGKIASVGQRLVEAAARAISKESLEGLNENVLIRAARDEGLRAGPPEPARGDPRGRGRPLPKLHLYRWRHSREIVVKQIDQTALAASIAKEVTKSLLPRPVMIAIAIGLVCLLGWVLAHR